MATAETVAEWALGRLAIADTVSSLAAPPTTQSANVRALLRYWDATMRGILSVQPWAFAGRTVALTGQTGTGTVSVTGTAATFSSDQDAWLAVGDTITLASGDESTIAARVTGLAWTLADTALNGASVSAFEWTKAVTLDPTDEWGYAYALPSDVLIVRRIVDGNRNPGRGEAVPFRKVGSVLYTDASPCVIEYTRNLVGTTEIAEWPDEVAQAFAARLAFECAPLLTGASRDGLALGNRALSVYRELLAEAAASDANEAVPDDSPDAELVRFRAGG